MFVVGCNFTRPGWLDRVWAHLTPEIAWRINLGLSERTGSLLGGWLFVWRFMGIERFSVVLVGP